MNVLDVGEIVIVHCREPREKLWGLLQRLDGVGVALRGMDLGAVEDWLRQEARGGDRLLTPSTFFVPMHRVQRIDLDEAVGPVSAFAARYREISGGDVRDALAPAEGGDQS
jgi:hypothetical protein